MQQQLEVALLPDAPLDAATAFMALYLPQARALIEAEGASALAIILPPAPKAHADWRRTLARDLAREYAPRRANVIAARPGAGREAMLQFLSDAPGVTGHYCEVDE
ncbi:MAG: Rossmann fold domain-containing protein [Erythrobacter sp.]